MVRIEEGVRRFHRDGFTFQRPAALLVVYENRAAAISHRHIVNRFALGFQCHVACRHGKAKARLALPIGRVCLYDVLTAGPLLELILDTRAPGKRNGHLGARQIVAGVGSIHDGAAVHRQGVGRFAFCGQGHVAFGHGKGKGIFGLPMARQIRWNCAAERPTLELLCSRVLRGRNGYLFTGIEAGIDDVVCLGGDAIRQGKGVKGGGFDAEIRLTRMITVACAMRMRFFRIACRGGIINTAHAIRRHILDRSHPAACAFVPDLHFWSIDKSGGGKIEKGFFVAYSSHRNTAAPVHRQLFIGHLSAIGGNVHRAITGDRSNALKGILTLARHRNITAGVIHGQAAVNCDSMRIAYVHTAACRNVGALCNCGLRCINRISGHGNGIAGVYVQVSAHSCALRVGDRHCAITGDVGVTDDRCIVSACTGHLNAAALGHAQAAAHSRAHKCSHARKKSKCILDLYRTIAGDHGIAACIIAKRIPMAACDRHAAIASGIVYIQAAQHHPVILGRQRDFAVAFLNFQGTGHAISAEGNVMHSGDHDRICDCCHIPMSADQLQIGPRIDRSQNCIAQQISILIAAQIKGHL